MTGRGGVSSFDGGRLKDARRARGLSQTDLETAAKVPQSNISQLEGGTRFPQPDVLARLAKAVGVRPERLCREVSDPGLRDLRERAGLLQEQAARRVGAGFSRSRYAMVESGATEKLADQAATKLARAFGVSIAAIIKAHQRDVDRRRSQTEDAEGEEP